MNNLETLTQKSLAAKADMERARVQLEYLEGVVETLEKARYAIVKRPLQEAHLALRTVMLDRLSLAPDYTQPLARYGKDWGKIVDQSHDNPDVVAPLQKLLKRAQHLNDAPLYPKSPLGGTFFRYAQRELQQVPAKFSSARNTFDHTSFETIFDNAQHALKVGYFLEMQDPTPAWKAYQAFFNVCWHMPSTLQRSMTAWGKSQGFRIPS